MNQIADESVQNMKWNQKSPNSKNKNKKLTESSEVNDDRNILSQEKICEVLANTLHINNVNNSNITNGSNDHGIEDTSSKSVNDSNAPQIHQALADNVNSIQSKNVEYTSEHRGTDLPVNVDSLEHNTCEQGQNKDGIEIISYMSELQMPEIMRIIQKDLSEPYSIYTYRYFIHNWPKLCFLATCEGKCIGAIVCKLDMHRNVVKRGYIAMLAVDEKFRKKGIGSRLVRKAIQVMIEDQAAEVVLETEITNKPALKLYENLGFVRDKRLFRYYLNGVDALRLKLWLR